MLKIASLLAICKYPCYDAYMQFAEKRSTCPIGLTLDVIGDRWSLLIIRSMLFAKRKTFKEISQIDEKIATNILSDRLLRLERSDIIMKLPDVEDGRRSVYELTQKGIELMPVLLAMIDWGMKYNQDASYPVNLVEVAVRDKRKLINRSKHLHRIITA